MLKSAETAQESRGTALPEVAGLGLIVLDQVVCVDRYPACDTKSFGSDPLVQVGGPVPTALSQLRKFGFPVRFAGSWADDVSGRAIETLLSDDDIAFDRVTCRTSNLSGFAHVWVESSTGRRTVVSVPPDGSPDSNAAAAALGEAKLLHLDGWGGDAAVAAAEKVHANGGRVTLDAGSLKPATERLLSTAAWLNAPRRFVTAFCGTSDVERAARQLLSAGPKVITITDGEHGAGVFTPDVAEWRPAFPVRAIDTCGAGDVFCGGMIAGLLFGLEPLPALGFAMATAAIKVSRRGNRELATYGDVICFLEGRS